MNHRIAILLLVLLATTPFAHAAVDRAALESAAGTAPLACAKGVCVGAGCKDNAFDGTCASGKCGSFQQWKVEGRYEKGNGTVTFRVQCGDESELVSCDVSKAGATCDSEIKGPGEGEFGCLVDLPPGVKMEDVTGFCEDPVNPRVIYLVAPSGLPYEMDKYALDVVEAVESVRVTGLV